jgi:hypothetical protein
MLCCILRISPDELGKVLRKLDSINPDCLLKKPDTNEMDVNTDLFTGSIFREINTFLDQVILDMGGFQTKRGVAAK